MNIRGVWEPVLTLTVSLHLQNTHRVQMGTPKRFQLATLWDNDSGFHTNEGSKYHQRGTWTPFLMHIHACMYVKARDPTSKKQCFPSRLIIHTKLKSQHPQPFQTVGASKCEWLTPKQCPTSTLHTHTTTHSGQLTFSGSYEFRLSYCRFFSAASRCPH